MNWIGELYDLYDKNERFAGKMEPGQAMLLPLYHTTVAAQITVTIDEKGNFLYAETVPEEEKSTIIPVTDKSSSRTAGVEPHPLCDNLKYLAGDYADYVTGKDCSKNHTLYMEQLRKWVESPDSHPKVEAIYHYLCKNTLVHDLVESGILTIKEDGMVDEKRKLQIVSQADAFVRFRVESDELLDDDVWTDQTGRFSPECWKDRTLQQSYINFCRFQRGGEGLSYLTGEHGRVSYLQPKKIRNEGDGAKLISSNDEANFTFKGRFLTKEEAFAIGYEDSQKVHNALKWILRKQGTNYDSMYFVTWESDSGKIPDWLSDSDEICRQAEEHGVCGEEKAEQKRAGKQDAEEADEGVPQSEIAEWEAEMNDEEDESGEYAETGEVGAARFQKAIKGYEKNLSQTSRTVIMAFDAATTGRLALMEFKDYHSSRYVDSLKRWYERCEWLQWKSGKKGRYSFLGMVGIKDAAELLYGTEQNGYFSMKGKENLYKEVAKRWMPCILDGKEVPVDMVRVAVRRASSPVSFDSRFQWERILALACSLVKQQYKKRYKEDWTMALDENCTRRDYLYGRLLAVADRIEYRTFDKDDGRQTNAKRYMNAFSQNPFRTWKILEEKLVPYLGQLNPPERLVYQNLIDNICSKFSIKDFEDDKVLDGLYLLGFHNQSYDLKKKKEDQKEEKINE